MLRDLFNARAALCQKKKTCPKVPWNDFRPWSLLLNESNGVVNYNHFLPRHEVLPSQAPACLFCFYSMVMFKHKILLRILQKQYCFFIWMTSYENLSFQMYTADCSVWRGIYFLSSVQGGWSTIPASFTENCSMSFLNIQKKMSAHPGISRINYLLFPKILTDSSPPWARQNKWIRNL